MKQAKSAWTICSTILPYRFFGHIFKNLFMITSWDFLYVERRLFDKMCEFLLNIASLMCYELFLINTPPVEFPIYLLSSYAQFRWKNIDQHEIIQLNHSIYLSFFDVIFVDYCKSSLIKHIWYGELSDGKQMSWITNKEKKSRCKTAAGWGQKIVETKWINMWY